MHEPAQSFGVRRVYRREPVTGGGEALHLSDRIVELGQAEAGLYDRLREHLPGSKTVPEWAPALGLTTERLHQLLHRFAGAGLLYAREGQPAVVSGAEFYHQYFERVLPGWLDEAFSHPFWERMTSGRGSRRLFAGWLIELYHYTKNANRHMPLSCAHAREKRLKSMRARHYAEEWNHYHYFSKALKALGFAEEDIARSVPLPMTLALSNFMRQAAREDVLCYSICSAVLEGTTTDRGANRPYYDQVARHYHLPEGAIQPIFAHLDLDVQYQHSNLFLDILSEVEVLSARRASRVLGYGHQLVEHIWLWTEAIERYYEVDANAMPRRPFDPRLD
jgi:pyrroloquinoline quinone (PQQ) biosynthesis protein C